MASTDHEPGTGQSARLAATVHMVAPTTTEVRWCFFGPVPPAAVAWIGVRPRRASIATWRPAVVVP